MKTQGATTVAHIHVIALMLNAIYHINPFTTPELMALPDDEYWSLLDFTFDREWALLDLVPTRPEWLDLKEEEAVPGDCCSSCGHWFTPVVGPDGEDTVWCPECKEV